MRTHSPFLRPVPVLAALALLASAALFACAPRDPSELGAQIIVRGAVTDAATGEPIDAVKVTLVSDATFPTRTTDARGLFVFEGVQWVDNLLVQYQKDGYRTVTLTIVCSACEGSVDGGGGGGGPRHDGYDASTALVRSYAVPVSGTVYSGNDPAKAAQVSLWNSDGQLAFSAAAGDDGRFTFAAVPRGTYDLLVQPWDRDADGQSDTQFYGSTLVVEPSSGANLGNVVINLADVTHALVASTIVSLSKPFPIAIADIVTGLTGVLQATGGSIFLHFGAEVDPALTAFELVPVEGTPSGAASRFGPPIALTVAWDHASVAKLTPASNLVASADGTIGYELRIRALRFRDGTVSIAPSPTAFGKIDFSVQALPAALASPTPAFYLANQLTATQAASTVAVDDSVMWLLDSNGDFVFDTVPGANWSSALPVQFTWPAVAGAVAYHLWVRNTVSLGNNTASTLDWRELTVTYLSPVQPNQSVPVAVSVNPWAASAGLGVGSGVAAGAPWRFGNTVQFAVTSEDALGFRSSIDTTKLLTTKDDFGGLLTAVAIDPAGQPAPFTPIAERGSTFTKTVKLTFSEPMNTSAAPTITSTGGALTLKKTLATTWGAATPEPAASSDSAVFVSLLLQNSSPCTELTLARVVGDTILPLRDSSLFTVSGTNRVLILDGGTGTFITESVGIAAVDPVTNRVTLTTALTAAPAAGALACALGTGGSAAFVSTATTSVVVSDAKAFAVGQTIQVYEPQVSGAGQIADLRTISALDTATNTLVLATALTAGHTTASTVFSLTTGGAEPALRSSVTLPLARDIAGGNDVDLFVTGPVTGVLVGDLVLVDVDGDLKTTVDQAQVKVKQVKFAPTVTPLVYSVVVDLPASFQLLHGKSSAKALGDSFTVGGTRDTSASAVKPLDLHRDQFSGDLTIY